MYKQSFQNMFFSSKYMPKIFIAYCKILFFRKKVLDEESATLEDTRAHIHKSVLVQRTDTRQSHDREHSGEAGRGTLEPPRGKTEGYSYQGKQYIKTQALHFHGGYVLQ